MTDQGTSSAGDTAPDAAAPATAGAMLRQAREDAGLTIDAIAQQLKLAPRQVRALEEGDFAVLPGRTFVRGFIRNYARLLRIDVDAVVAALEGSVAAPTLAAPTLQPTPPSIGELPTVESNRPGWTRWAIPLTLAAIVAAAAVYEFLRPGAELWRGGAPSAVSVPAATGAAPSLAVAPADNDTITALPNPMAAAGREEPAPASVPAPAASTPVPAAIPPAVPVAAAARVTAPVKQPAATPAKPPVVSVETAGAAVADVSLALTFRDYSWVEVKDRNGRLLLSRMNAGGTTESVSGPPPLDVVIGNANDVKVTFRGKPVDLAPHTRQNIARLTLP